MNANAMAKLFNYVLNVAVCIINQVLWASSSTALQLPSIEYLTQKFEPFFWH